MVDRAHKYVYHRNPTDWFEGSVSILLDLELYVRVPGFYKNSWEFRQLILGPFTYKPKPFSKLGNIGSSGSLSLDATSEMTCESKGGSVGQEDLQCTEDLR